MHALHTLDIVSDISYDDNGQTQVSVRTTPAKLLQLFGEYKLTAKDILAAEQWAQLQPILEEFERVAPNTA